MKIKGTISTIMFKIFFVLSLVGFAVLCSISDVADGGFKYLILLVAAWLICMFLAFIFYNTAFIKKHIFAIYCTIMLFHGCIHKIISPKYRWFYRTAIEAGTVRKYYTTTMRLYESYNSEI